jgi:HEAT repeat protein
MLPRGALCLGCLLLFAGLFPPAAEAQSARTKDLMKGVLNDKSPKDRIVAAEELGNLGAIKLSEALVALPALRAALQKDSDPTVRKAALDAIVKIEPDKGLELLIDTFKKDKEPVIRLGIIATFSQRGIQAKEAVPVLHETLLEPFADKGKVSKEPKTPQPKDQPKPPPLTPPAKDADPQAVRKAIIPILRQLQPEPKEYLPVLLEVLKKDKEPTVRLAAAQALGQLAGRAKDAAPALQEAFKHALLEARNTPLPPNVTDTDANGLRKGILTALAQIEPDAKARVPLWIDALKKDREPSVRAAGAAALGQLGPAAQAAVPALLDVQKQSLAQSSTADVSGLRKAVLEALARIEPDAKEQLPYWLDALKKDRDPAVLQTATAAVGRLGAPAKSAQPLVKEALRYSLATQPASDAQGLRKTALEVLPKLGVEAKEYVNILGEQLRLDRDPEVRSAAITALGQLGPAAKNAVPLLLEVQKAAKVGNDRDKTLATEIDAALKKIQGK